MMLDNVAQIITLAACAALIAITEPALNRCTIKTRRCMRLSLLLICAGAVLTLASVIPGVLASPWPGAAALTCGMALMLLASNRRTLRPPR